MPEGGLDDWCSFHDCKRTYCPRQHDDAEAISITEQLSEAWYEGLAVGIHYGARLSATEPGQAITTPTNPYRNA